MRKATRKFKLGVVVIGSSVLFLSMVLFILGSSLTSEMVQYHIFFDESVKGMVIGSKVNFQGIPVGTVSDIRFAEGRTRVEISVDPDKAEIQKDVTFASMDRLMITGQVTIELNGFNPDGEALLPGGGIPPQMSAFDEFAQSLPEVVASADDLLLSLTDLVDRTTTVLDDETVTNLRQTAANMAQVSGMLADELQPLVQDARESVAALRPALDTMETSFNRISDVAGSQELADALVSVTEAMAKIDRIEAEALLLLTDLRGVVGGSRRDWLGALSVARDALGEIRMLARNLRMAPSTLMFGRTENEITVPAAPTRGKK